MTKLTIEEDVLRDVISELSGDITSSLSADVFRVTEKCQKLVDGQIKIATEAIVSRIEEVLFYALEADHAPSEDAMKPREGDTGCLPRYYLRHKYLHDGTARGFLSYEIPSKRLMLTNQLPNPKYQKTFKSTEIEMLKIKFGLDLSDYIMVKVGDER